MKRVLIAFLIAALTPQVLLAQSRIDSFGSGLLGEPSLGARQVFQSQLTTQEVLRLQRALSILGYYNGPFDGEARPPTWDAVTNWAKAHDWKPPTTLRSAHVAALEAEVAQHKAASASNMTNNSDSGDQIVSRVQKALFKLGYYTGPVSGRSTPETMLALAKWAKDRGWKQPTTIREAHASYMENELVNLNGQSGQAPVQTSAASDWIVTDDYLQESSSCVPGQYEKICLRIACDIERGTILDVSALPDAEGSTPRSMTLNVDDQAVFSVKDDPIETGPLLDSPQNATLLAQIFSGRSLKVTVNQKTIAFGTRGFSAEYERVRRGCDTRLARLKSGENPFPGQALRLADETAIPPVYEGKWSVLKDQDISGRDVRHGLKDGLLRAMTLEQCARLCDETGLCLAYTYNPRGGTCFLKSGASSTSVYPGATSATYQGKKASFDPPPTDGPGPVVDGAVRWREADKLSSFQERVKDAARTLGDACDVEEATIQSVARSLTWTMPTASGRVGSPIDINWSGNGLTKRIPIWIVVSSKSPIRFSGEGQVALGPDAPNPFGIGASIGETRALVSLATRGAGSRGTIRFTPITASRLDLSVKLVAYIRKCKKEVTLNQVSQSMEIAPAAAQIVLNTAEGRAAYTHSIELSNFSRRILLNDTRFLLLDSKSGTEVVERGGADIDISPTHRFIALKQNGKTEIVDVIDGRTVARMDSGTMRWGLGDSVAFTSSLPWAKVNLQSTFGDYLQVDDQLSGPACCEAARGSTRVGVDLENATFSIWGTLGYRVGALQNVNYGSVSNPQGGYSSEHSGSLALNLNTLWSLGMVSPISVADDFDVAGGFIQTSDWADANLPDGGGPRPFAERLQRVLSKVGLSSTQLDHQDIDRAGSPLNSRPVAESFINQLSRIGVEVVPMVDGAELVNLDNTNSAYLFQDRIDKTKVAMEQLGQEAHLAGWQTAWSLPESAEMNTECEHIPASTQADRGAILLPRDVVEATKVKTERGAVWVTRSDCVAGATFGSLRPFTALHIVDLGVPLTKSKEAVLSKSDFFYENSAPRIWYNQRFRIKANDSFLLIYMPGGGAAALVDRVARKFIWMGEDLPGGDLVVDAWLTKDCRHIVQLNSDGNFYFHSIDGKATPVLFGRLVDDEVGVWTADYHYDSTAEAAALIDLKFPGQPGQFSLDRFGSKRLVPSLAAMVLTEKAALPGDDEIGVPPSLGGTLSLGVDGRVSATLDFDPKSTARLSVFQDGALTDSFEAAEPHKAFTFQRLKGARWISVIASSASDLTSLPVTTDLGPSSGQNATGRVLVIGVNTYENKDIPSLNYPLRDAGRMLEVLTTPHGGEPPYTMVEGPKDRRATPEAILEATTHLLDGLSRGDHAVLFLAGHGVRDTAGRFYFATSKSDPADLEHTALPFDQLAALFETTQAQVTIFLDACHSGLAGDGILATNDDLANSLARLRSNVTIFAAAKGRQESQGRRETGGLFTDAVATVLADRRSDYDLNGNGRIEASELYRGVKSIVVRESEGQQTPWIVNSRLVGEYALF